MASNQEGGHGEETGPDPHSTSSAHGTRARRAVGRAAEARGPAPAPPGRTVGPGLPTPLLIWLRCLRLDRKISELLSAKDFLRLRFFHRDPLQGREEHEQRLWALLSLELWSRVFLEGSVREEEMSQQKGVA